MHKLVLKYFAILVSVALGVFMFSSCGDDDDDDDGSPATGPEIAAKFTGPTSLTYQGVTLVKFEYDSKGRVTRIRNYDGGEVYFDFQVSYSPIKLTIKEEDEIVTFTDVQTNSNGLITKAKITDVYEDEKETYWVTLKYDNESHLVSASADGDVTTYKWSNGNLVSAHYMDGDVVSIGYSSEVNSAKNICYNAFSFILGLNWMTGLFGDIPRNFPNRVIDEDGDGASFSYTLDSDGKIKTETIIESGYDSFTIDYNYGSRASESVAVSGDMPSVKSVKSFNLFKRVRK